ncbi:MULTISPECIES: ABC transporter ATP-binding protein [Brevibacillus]|uniref:ABC transporter ATP-binding protein n=1 Tax=Brevibacillus TaxID=55080 RepID=UPI000EE5A808|nr:MULTISPECIES: ABC transporter transmembrane domain-containing protein [Brevibacillus]MBU8715136.1 ATP-binding cassette domain-containing protein [Brevibacillus parabrevis]MDR4999929.1 ABC transporter transmembrane domain-containing protein [Brevibacillus parabrevis]UED69901.1 ATP-binding cassette domain-containing protein [Brevibacillus sp. HD3.3A]HBZ82697.1 multidrug ABC transporter permease/ATP-binding protein [Brevibacillus sp.]
MFSVLTKLDWFFKEHWKRYTAAILLLILGGILEIIPPKIIGVAIDEMQLGTLTGERLWSILLFYIVLAIVTYLINFVWICKLFGGAFLAERTLRSKLMTHFLRMTPTFYQRNRTGDLMARATNDLKAVSMTTGFGILTLVDSASFTGVIILTMGIFISWKLTLAAILPLPIMAYAINQYGKKIHERFSKAQDSFGELNDRVLESVAGVRVVRAYVQETADQERFSNKTREVFQKNMEVAKVDSLIEPTVKILVGISYMIGLIYGGYLVFRQELTLGELVSFNVYLGMLIWPMFAIGELINVLQRGSASLDRVNETLAYEADVTDHEQPARLAKPEAIRFEQVSFRYPGTVQDQLKNISFTLNRSQTLGIVGRTGSGKSTLLRQLLREFPLGQGAITINQIPLAQIELDNIKSWIGYVPQEQILFSRSVRENVMFGKQDATEEQLQEALKLAAFAKDVQFLPEGLDTLVGEKGVALSGGQKQRVSIARALMTDPEILILDDAMSAVDGKTEAEMIANIRRERAGKTTLIATHRLSAVAHADWILVMDEGKVVEEGTHEQLLAWGGWYKEQFEKQQIEAQLTEGG